MDYFRGQGEELRAGGGARSPADPLAVSVADFIAGMTDRYAMNLYRRLFLPEPWKIY